MRVEVALVVEDDRPRAAERAGGAGEDAATADDGAGDDVDANIYTVNVDGSGLTQVTHTGGSQSPDWGTHPLAQG